MILYAIERWQSRVYKLVVYICSKEYSTSILIIQQVEAIKTYFVENEGLFAKIARRQALWRRMIELEEAQKDPNRLKKARGTQLLDEERDKKRINKVKKTFNLQDILFHFISFFNFKLYGARFHS